MDNQWNNLNNYGTTTLPQTHNNAQEPPTPTTTANDKINMSTGHYTFAQDARGPSSLSNGVKQSSSLFHMSDIGSYNSVNPESVNSFLSLLSAPPSHPQQDYQQQSNMDLSACGNGGTIPNWIVLHNDREYPRAQMSFHPAVPSTSNICANEASIQFQSNDLDMTRAITTNKGFMKNSVRNSSLPNNAQACTSIVDTNLWPATNTNTKPEVHLQTLSSTSKKQTSAFSGYPRVLCMASSGDLLVSNTGFFGILCSCHRVHLSVSNFCKHSGLSNVNPGSAVRMESGESIAEWRKMYLLQFGIKAPEDHSGWEWPEGLLLKTHSTRSCISGGSKGRVFDLSSLFTTSAESVTSVQPRNKPNENSGEQQKSFLGGCNESSKKAITMANNAISISSRPSCSVASKAHGSSKDSRRLSRSLHDNAIPVSENWFKSACGNFQIAGSKTCNNLKDGNVLQRGKHSSGTELMLGQPAQHGFVSRSTALLATNSYNSNSQISTSQQQLSQNSRYSKVTDNSTQQNYCHPTSDFSRSKNPVQLSVMHNPPITSNKLSCLDHLHDGLSNGTLAAVYSPSSNSAGSSLHCEERNGGTTNGDPLVSRRLHPQSFFNRSAIMEFSCNGGYGSKHPEINKLTSQKKEEGFVDADNGKKYSSYEIESNLSLNAMQMQNPGFSTRNGKSYDPNSYAVPRQKSDSNKVSSMLLDAFGNLDCAKSACNLQRSPDAGHFSQRIVSSAWSFNKSPTMQAASAGFSPVTVVVAPGDISVSLNVNQHSKGDSLKGMPWQVDQSFIKTPAITALGLNQHICSYSDKSEQSKSCSVADLRLQGTSMDSGPPGCSKNGQTFNDLLNASKHFVTGVNDERIGDASKLTTRKGVKTLGCSGAFGRSVSRHTEMRDQHYQWYQRSYPKEQPSLSLGREENSTSDFDTLQLRSGASCTSSTGRICCDVQAVCTNERSKSGGASTMDYLKNQSSASTAEYSNLDVSTFVEESATVEKAIIIESNEKKHKEMTNKLICFDSLWRDVCPKENGVASLKCPGAQFIDCHREPKHGLSKFAAVISESDKVSEVYVGKESSKDSSGCSTAATTQVLVEDTNFNFHKTAPDDDGCEIKKFVDQGSVNDSSWLSADVTNSVRSPQLACCVKDKPTEETLFKPFPIVPSDSLTEDLKFSNSKEWEIARDVCEVSCGETSSITQGCTVGFTPRKRKRQVKQRSIGSSLTVPDISLPSTVSTKHCDAVKHDVNKYEHDEVVYQISNDSSVTFDGNYEKHDFKQRSSAVYSCLKLSCNTDVAKIYNIVVDNGDDQKKEVGSHDSLDTAENSVRKTLRHGKPAITVEKHVESAECCKDLGLNNPNQQETSKYLLRGCQEAKLVCAKDAERRKVKPVAFGKYGIICNEEFDIDQLKPPKVVPLRCVLKAARKITNLRTESDPRSARKFKVGSSCGNILNDRTFSSEAGLANQYQKAPSFKGEDCGASMHKIQRMCHEEDDKSAPVLLRIDKFMANTSQILDSNVACRSTAQPKPKKTRMRSLYELSMRGKRFIVAGSSPSQGVTPAQAAYCGLKRKASEISEKDDINNFRVNCRRSSRKARYNSLIIQSEALCCVCGISDQDDNNCLLECIHCAIQIHQACYGISKVPTGDWYCRPCRTNSKNAACVLCGYGDGAMTRAFGSKKVVKGLLKPWRVETESDVPLKIKCENKLESAEHQPYLSSKQMHNSVVSGLVDSAVKQWVHMVCGLWTPGSRCSNVDTMSAFDVSGVSQPKENVVCYLCKRPGGSCIQCHIEDCRTNFHPWCAHQKGLLQSQIEGAGADDVDFFGVCVYHADHHLTSFEANTGTDKIVCDAEQEKEPTCARTEGYKGKKQEGGWHSSFNQQYARGGSLVTQVQLDAWLYINRHKLGMKRLPTPPTVDVDHDYKKEYARYKQAKGWKHLVVYKSAIHALGLYTSQFIPRGAMVVEYIGEIVGLRVADKRESDYLCGRKLQYKSACYFFRIDKEQIIDATNKGGIARFVNHSCQPNCIARIITIRNEKKVLFFAQRDICPGEEVTYDYHFNHEDDGKKLPCLCKSRNCRRFLN